MFKRKFYIFFWAGLLFVFLNYHTVFSMDINLDDLSASLQIPASEDTLRLTRGTYTYILKKQADMNNKKYMVYMVDNITFDSSHKSAPDDAYSRTLDVFSADDQSAVRAMRSFSSMQKDMLINSPEDMAKAQQMVADSQHFNQAKFIIGILPSDSAVRSVSKQIKKGDTIKVSGAQFKLLKVINNGKEEPISHCLGSMDVFYLTNLKIEKY